MFHCSLSPTLGSSYLVISHSHSNRIFIRHSNARNSCHISVLALVPVLVDLAVHSQIEVFDKHRDTCLKRSTAVISNRYISMRSAEDSPSSSHVLLKFTNPPIYIQITEFLTPSGKRQRKSHSIPFQSC